MTSSRSATTLAIVLIVAGVAATIGGLYGQIFLGEDEGHHDGRDFTFARTAQVGADELVVTADGPNRVRAEVLRAGQAIGVDDVHGGGTHFFVVAQDLSYVAHTVADQPSAVLDAPAGRVRVIAQVAPSGGDDFVELGADVVVGGDEIASPVIVDDDEWSDGGVVVRRQFLDFVLDETWNGEPVFEGPAFLTLYAGEDLAFVHAHGEVVDPRRFSFDVNLPGLGEYLAALEFEQDGELVTALFRFTL
ncbi:MAG: hypothetical protein AB8G26_17070 [Ilumatobacter sp.]